MYLSRKQIRALETALEAMEGYPFASYNADQNEAINTIVAMLNSARREDARRYAKREDAKLKAQLVDSVARGFNAR